MDNQSSAAAPAARPSDAEAQQVLRDLSQDRARLAERLAAPWWLYPCVALLSAGYVATPAIEPDAARTAVVGAVIAAALVVFFTCQRSWGVRVGRAGPRGAVLLVGLIGAILLLLSTSYALVSLLGGWWVLAPAVACFLLVLVGGRWFDRLYRENLRRGR